jgi:hypothetical protein
LIVGRRRHSEISSRKRAGDTTFDEACRRFLSKGAGVTQRLKARIDMPYCLQMTSPPNTLRSQTPRQLSAKLSATGNEILSSSPELNSDEPI